MTVILCCIYLRENGFWPKVEHWSGHNADYRWAVEATDEETIAKSMAFRLGDRSVFDVDVEHCVKNYSLPCPASEALLTCPKGLLGRDDDGPIYAFTGDPFFSRLW